MPIEIITVPFDHPDAARLREAQQAEIRARYDDSDTEPGVTPSAADSTVFVVASIDGTAVGCGGLRRLDATSGELKRMFVLPERRGQGIADAVLRALEEHARDLGWTHLRLETGPRQTEAISFYRRLGYAPIPPFGDYVGQPSSLCFERAL